MLQRAASNAYSWWWASHIRTKQSKWLEQNLQDMEEKVQIVLKMIEEDGDSFAKRAEMYYKKRPELISFVEESYRAYRALAERYDKISTELQNANNTIASVFPEQVQFAIDEEEEDRDNSKNKTNKNKRNNKEEEGKDKDEEEAASKKIPVAPIGPVIKPLLENSIPTTMNAKILARKKTMKRIASTKTAPKLSGLSRSEAMEEIDKVQKQILALQTEKEFVKSSYESGVAKYWEIESSIKEKQDRVSSLQDEFGEGILIDDGEARSLMAEAALKSCQDKLARLRHKQETSAEEAVAESLRIKEVRARLHSLKLEIRNPVVIDKKPQETVEEVKEREKLEAICKKIKDQFESKSGSSTFTVTQMVEKIDELVNKVISLETAVSSQAALVERLKSETDELQAQVRSLEGDSKAMLVGSDNKIREMEEKLDGILVLDKSFKDQNDNLKMHFTEANCNLDHLSDKLQCVRPDEEENEKSQDEIIVPSSISPPLPSSLPETPTEGFDFKVEQVDVIVNPFVDFPTGTKNPFVDFEEVDVAVGDDDDRKPKADEPDWQKMFEEGMEGKEKTLLTEYTTTLRSYKEAKKQLGEAEIENSMQLKELKTVNAKKDEEIRSLRLKLGLLEDSPKDEFAGFQTALTLSKDHKKEDDDEEDEVDIKSLLSNQAPAMSATEEKFRMDIDELLEENLDFWLRFSSSFHQIQKFDTEVEDLKSEIKRLRERRNDPENSTNRNGYKSEARPLYKHLREIQTELSMWLEKSVVLKEELQCRFSSLCEIQEEITRALKASAEEEDFFRFTSYQAAKFQGEVLNMKQENNKVADELQAGLDHVTAMQIDVETVLERLDDDFDLSGGSKKKKVGGPAESGGPSEEGPPPQLRSTSSRSRIPLRSFIFGVRSKKQKPSIFACVTPVMNMNRKFHGLKTTGHHV